MCDVLLQDDVYDVYRLRESFAVQRRKFFEKPLLYTGVTRGKQLVVVIGQPRALAIAVRNVRATQRLTNLAARLREGK